MNMPKLKRTNPDKEQRDKHRLLRARMLQKMETTVCVMRDTLYSNQRIQSR